jgi:serine phosphatase RsbU (regulator of sigma subunit)
MTIRAYIVDDEPPARVRLRQMLSEVADVRVVGEAGDAIEARGGIAAARPDVVFLDIEMPQMSGTTFAGTLPEPRPFLVFATAFDRYALDAFAVDATDYLVKPITRARLSSTLSRVRERLAHQSDLERELVVASATQAALLSRSLPGAPAYDAAALTIAARGVGGDFFLGHEIADGRLAFALGDVAGKGMSAGLVASSLQARIETVAAHGHSSPCELVAEVNRALWGTTDGARFATLAYIEIDAVSGRTTVVNAGHLPVVVASADGHLELLPATSPAVGLFADARFTSRSLTLEKGSTLAIYSDGVTEALDGEGEEFGEARLLPAIAIHTADPSTTSAVLCHALVDAVAAHVGRARAVDDVTVMAIGRVSAADGEGR